MPLLGHYLQMLFLLRLICHCDELATCAGCTPPLTQCQLGQAPASSPLQPLHRISGNRWMDGLPSLILFIQCSCNHFMPLCQLCLAHGLLIQHSELQLNYSLTNCYVFYSLHCNSSRLCICYVYIFFCVVFSLDKSLFHPGMRENVINLTVRLCSGEFTCYFTNCITAVAAKVAANRLVRWISPLLTSQQALQLVVHTVYAKNHIGSVFILKLCMFKVFKLLVLFDQQS